MLLHIYCNRVVVHLQSPVPVTAGVFFVPLNANLYKLSYPCCASEVLCKPGRTYRGKKIVELSTKPASLAI